MYTFLLFLVIGYLMGSVCFGYLVAKLKGINVCDFGSKTPTSTNISRALGFWWGLGNGIMDVAKAFIPVFAAKFFITEPWQLVAIAIAPIIGHLFPVWFGFKGGKGGAPFIGGMLALTSTPFYLPIFGVFCLIVALTRWTSVANLLHPWLFVVASWLWYPEVSMRPWLVVYGIFGAIILTYGLRDNVKRLLAGQEPKMDFSKKLAK